MGWSWLAIAAVILVAILALLNWSARCRWKKIKRDRIAFCLLALMRLYRDSATILVALERSAVPLLRVDLGYSIGDKCDLVFKIVDGDLLWRHRAEFLRELESREFGGANSGDHYTSEADVLAVNVSVDDIWQPTAAGRAASVANCLLDIAGVDCDARLDVWIRGKRSLDRTLEAQRRQRDGDDQAFPGFVEEVDGTKSQ